MKKKTIGKNTRKKIIGKNTRKKTIEKIRKKNTRKKYNINIGGNKDKVKEKNNQKIVKILRSIDKILKIPMNNEINKLRNPIKELRNEINKLRNPINNENKNTKLIRNYNYLMDNPILENNIDELSRIIKNNNHHIIKRKILDINNIIQKASTPSTTSPTSTTSSPQPRPTTSTTSDKFYSI